MSTKKKRAAPKVARTSRDFALDLLQALEPVLVDYMKSPTAAHKDYAVGLLKEARKLLAEDVPSPTPVKYELRF